MERQLVDGRRPEKDGVDVPAFQASSRPSHPYVVDLQARDVLHHHATSLMLHHLLASRSVIIQASRVVCPTLVGQVDILEFQIAEQPVL